MSSSYYYYCCVDWIFRRNIGTQQCDYDIIRLHYLFIPKWTGGREIKTHSRFSISWWRESWILQFWVSNVTHDFTYCIFFSPFFTALFLLFTNYTFYLLSSYLLSSYSFLLSSPSISSPLLLSPLLLSPLFSFYLIFSRSISSPLLLFPLLYFYLLSSPLYLCPLLSFLSYHSLMEAVPAIYTYF